jgi:cell division protein FtsL
MPLSPLWLLVLGVGSVIAIIAASLQAALYKESNIILRQDRLIVNNWTNLQTDTTTVTLWDRVEDINVLERGILAQTFSYGTIKIEAASGDGAMLLPYVPDPEKWRDVMIARGGEFA